MTLTPAIKGQLTKAVKANPTTTPGPQMQARFVAIRTVFLKHLPPQQAKHATRKFISELAAK